MTLRTDDDRRRYQSAHRHIRRVKGRASEHPCAICGGAAQDWSRDNDAEYDTRNQDHFEPLCRACHTRKDNDWMHQRNQGERAARSAGLDRLDSLRQLADLRAMLDEQTAEVVRALRSEQGGSHSWAEIGEAVGLSRAAALRRFGAAESDARRVGGQPSRLR